MQENISISKKDNQYVYGVLVVLVLALIYFILKSKKGLDNLKGSDIDELVKKRKLWLEKAEKSIKKTIEDLPKFEKQFDNVYRQFTEMQSLNHIDYEMEKMNMDLDISEFTKEDISDGFYFNGYINTDCFLSVIHKSIEDKEYSQYMGIEEYIDRNNIPDDNSYFWYLQDVFKKMAQDLLMIFVSGNEQIAPNLKIRIVEDNDYLNKDNGQQYYIEIREKEGVKKYI